MSTGGEAIWQNIKDGGKRPFLVAAERSWSYARLEEAVRQWLALFDASQVAQGDRFVLCSEDEFLTCSGFIAGLLDGRVPVNLAPDTPLLRLQAVSRSVEAGLLVHDGAEPVSGLSDAVTQICLGREETERPKQGLLARLSGKAERVLPALPAAGRSREPELPADTDGLAYLLFTSGTTSAPTGVQITRGNLYANLETLIRLFGYDEQSRIFNDMVLAHADGMIQGPVLATACGGAVVRSGGFALPRLEQWLERVRATRATHVITVPTIWAMIESYAAHDDYFDAPECISLQSVAAKLPTELWDRLEGRFGMPIASHYGLTETVASALYAGPHPEMGPRGTLGKPVDCAARIDPAAEGTEGELQLRGTNVFPGYWRNDERNRACFTDDGWFRTGDIARAEHEGHFTILGRLKNIIMTGGFLIRPDEIDEAMLRHPLVRESVTVGLEDETFGEIAATAVVLSSPVDEDDLVTHARDHLEARKVPRQLLVMAQLPRGISGKPDLNAVIAAFAGERPEQQQAETATDLDKAVIALAADVFRVKPEAVDLSHGPDALEGWDSFSQLSLVLEAEARFAISIPAARIASIETLRDIRDAIREQQA